MSDPYRIDVHHHYVPPPWLQARPAEIYGSVNSPPELLRGWSASRTREALDRHAIEYAVLSLSTPGVWFGEPAESARLARDCNEYGASVVREHPGRFGVFAALPLPDVDASLAEIAHALDELELDGIGLLTSYDGSWLGSARFAPVLEELDRRRAVVFVHPTAPACCAFVDDIPPSLTEFPFDTTRAITSLLYSGSLARFPQIRWIFSHGGGTVPMLAGRFAGNSYARSDAVRRRTGERPAADLRRLYYDVVAVTNEPAMAALRAFAPADRLLFGTDAPFIAGERTIEQLGGLGIEPGQMRRIERENALPLLPRLGSGG